jgi:hypothetical protein
LCYSQPTFRPVLLTVRCHRGVVEVADNEDEGDVGDGEREQEE